MRTMRRGESIITVTIAVAVAITVRKNDGKNRHYIDGWNDVRACISWCVLFCFLFYLPLWVLDWIV